MILKINHNDPDVRRKGQVLAIILLGIATSTVVLSTINVLLGQYEYNAPNAAFLALILGLFVVNRLGYVPFAATLTTVLMAMTPLSALSTEVLVRTFIAMCVPVFVASFLIVPWSGIVVAAAVISYIVFFSDAFTSYLSLFSLATVSVIVYLLAESLERAHRRNRHMAFHDGLTDLPNRALLLERLRQAMVRSGKNRNTCALLFMDLDNFKVINDSLGHEFGDELLVVVARRLRACLRSKDTAARLGGDEFIVVLDGIAEVDDAVRVAGRICEELQAPIELRGRRVFVNTSVGIAVNEPADTKPESLLRNADAAMYEAKKEGKARVKVFDRSMHTRALRRLELENELRQAIERGELRTYYQPKVRLNTGRLVGLEALVRWEHPKRGLVYPEEFIPLAEETGLIVPLGQWMLREVCHQAREWQERCPGASPLVMSVNLSVRQFQQPNLVQELREILRKTGLDPRCLQLEITESVVTDDVEYAVRLLEELKGLEVRLAIDDFGKGYSSLDYLKRFPLDALKVDRAFVCGLGNDAQDTAIVQLVVDLAHTVGMEAIAEGVETAEQLVLLREMGCDLAQGYYFERPLTGEATTVLLDGSPRSLLFADLPKDETGNG